MPSKELVISQSRHETKVAILEDGQLVELFFQRANEYSLAGSIHKGRVTRVLPGMQSAFVDLGLERDCFLYVSDFFEENADEIDRVEDRRSERSDRGDRGGRNRDRDRDRDRDRNNRNEKHDAEFTPLPAAAPVVEGEPVEIVAISEAGEAAPTDAAAAGDDRGERRGRRSRRRRRGGRGIPESKYASPTDESVVESEGGEEGDAEAGVELSEEVVVVEETVEPVAAEVVAEPEPEAAPAAEILVLPGESLAKYRRQAKPVEEPVAPVAEEAEVVESAEEAAEAAAEAILDRVDDLQAQAEALIAADPETEAEAQSGEPASASLKVKPDTAPMAARTPKNSTPDSEPAAASDPEVLIEPSASAASEPEILVEPSEAAASESDALPEPPAPVESDPEILIEPAAESASRSFSAEPEAESSTDEAAQESVEADADESAAEEGAVAEGEEGPEPARQPMSLTSQLREKGGRAAHRLSRRMRRRARLQAAETDANGAEPEAEGETAAPVANPMGDPIVATPIVTLPGEEIAAARTSERAEREPRERDRERGRDRDRGDRGERGERSERAERGERGERAERSERPPLPSIADLLKEGQEIIVQIAKEPLGTKGARITSHIALPGRYVVYMPTVEHLGVSRKIGSDEERARLKKILQKHREGVAGGFIMRTAGEGRTEEEVAADMQYLANLWLDIKNKAEKRRAPMLLHHDVEVVQRLLRDQLTDGFKAVWVDNEDLYEQTLNAVQRIAPTMLNRVKLYTRPEPIFDAFGISQELEKALRPKVWLKSGGFIVINQTEALVAIDVNTGKYVGKTNRLEDTIVKTNLEAVKEIVRQMRLRDLGGIIVCDFIDMDERKNRQKVMQALEETMRADKAPYKILPFNDFGLVAITRKRVKQSLERALCAPCPYCEGAGYVRSVPTVINEILAQALKYAKVVDGKECLLRCHPEVAKVLKSVENKYLEELEEILGRPVLVKADELLHQEKFDLT